MSITLGLLAGKKRLELALSRVRLLSSILIHSGVTIFVLLLVREP